MQKTKDVTLAICAYNCEQYIEETLSCIMAQTFQGFELLIVNDCSTDKTLSVIERFFENNPRQHELINFKENQGIGYARHFAERHAKTTYMLFIDADDLPYPALVDILYNKIDSDNDLMGVGCYLEYIDQKGKKLGGGLFLGESSKTKFIEKAAAKKLIFMQPTAIYNRELSLSVGGYIINGYSAGKPRYQDYCEDLDLWTRMSDLYTIGKAIVVVPEVLCGYRKHQQGLSASSFNMIIRIRHIKKNLLRRRVGEKELTFIEFYNSLSVAEMKKLRCNSVVADSLRNGVFLLKKGHIIKGCYYILKSIVLKPSYLWEKLMKNSGILR
jgi:glycosyltransferase involved in cell wall biosynthesis